MDTKAIADQIQKLLAQAVSNPPESQEAASAVDWLNKAYGADKVFFEVNKMGLCARVGAGRGTDVVDLISGNPFIYQALQFSSYVELEQPDGTGFKVVKSRFDSQVGQVLYKSSLG